MSEPVRVYLCGGLAIRQGQVVLGPADFAGPQTMLLFAMLSINHLRPVSSDELADAIWCEQPPPGWRGSMRALVSRVRASLVPLRGVKILSGDSWYQVVLPVGSSVDCLAAAAAAHDAEALLDSGRIDDATAHAAVAAMIAMRPALPEVSHPWVDALGGRTSDVHMRALDALVRLWTLRGQYAEAIVDAEKLLAIDPLHESAYAGLMRAHLLAGTPTMGLRAYERCRQVMRLELGASPGPSVEAIYRELLAVT